MPSAKVYRGFSIVDRLVSIIGKVTKGTPLEKEAAEVTEEFNEMYETWLENIVAHRPLTEIEARELIDKIQSIQQRMSDIIDRVNPN